MSLTRVAAALLWSALAAGAQGVVMETSTVRFQVANPEPRGTVVEQARRARESIKGRVYKYRIFVRPETDVGLFSTIFRAPVLSIIRVAGLPAANQKLSVEAITSGGRNPAGLVFISGQGVSRDEPIEHVAPLVTEAFDNVDKALRGAQLGPESVLTVTCYAHSLADAAAVQRLSAARYPQAVSNLLQIPLPYGRALVECEAVARAAAPVGFLWPEGLVKSPNFSQVAGISTPRITFSALHGARPCTADAVRQMFQSLAADLMANGASIDEAAFSYVYPNTNEGTDLTRAIRFEFYSKERPPASTLLPFYGFVEKGVCTGVEAAAPVR